MTAPSARGRGATDPGLQRDDNEDRFHVDAARGLFMVIDGVGGQAAGGKAADARAVDAARPARTRDRPGGRARARSDRGRQQRDSPRRRVAGPNGTAWRACSRWPSIKDGVATVGHVGDTRLYKIRQGRIEKVTRDHSPVGEREDAGELSESEAMRHPRRNEVYRDVGSEPHQPGDADFVDIVTVPVEPDAALLLCSDGLSDLVPAGTIAAHRRRSSPAIRRASCAALVEAANEAGGKDNVTVVYVEGERFGAGGDGRRRAGRATTSSRARVAGGARGDRRRSCSRWRGMRWCAPACVRWPAESVTLPRAGAGASARVGRAAGRVDSRPRSSARPGAQVIVEPASTASSCGSRTACAW